MQVLCGDGAGKTSWHKYLAPNITQNHIHAM